MNLNVIEKQITRVNYLLNRLDTIPAQLNIINDELFSGYVPAKRFNELTTRRTNLKREQENKKRELFDVYRIIDKER